MSDALKDLFGSPGNSDSILQNLNTICRVRAKDEEEMWVTSVALSGCMCLLRSKVGHSLLATSSQATFWATCMLRGVVMCTATASPDNAHCPPAECDSAFTRAFCLIVGGGQVGTMIAYQLLDIGWPSRLIEVAVSDDTQRQIKDLKIRGIKCALGESIYEEKLGQAMVVILAIRPSNLEHFIRAAGKHMPQNALVVSCLSGVPVAKLKVSLNSNHIIRTMVSSSRLPLDRSANDSTQGAIDASLFHAITNAEDANSPLDVLTDLFRKKPIDKNIIPKSVATAPEFMQFARKVVKDRGALFH